jgi:hypothetical protein
MVQDIKVYPPFFMETEGSLPYSQKLSYEYKAGINTCTTTRSLVDCLALRIFMIISQKLKENSFLSY